MRLVTLPVPLLNSSPFQRRIPRFAPRCVPLENRQLLSSLQPATSAAPLTLPAAGGPGSTAPAVSDNGVVNQSNVATQVGAAGGASYGQVGYLLDELAASPTPLSPSNGVVATPAPLSANPSANLTGSTLTLTNLSVTWLNPEDTSSEDAITDTQVNADAYLLPSTSQVLEDHLGESTIAGVTHSNLNSNAVFNPQPATVGSSSLSSVTVSKFGQSAPAAPGVNLQASTSPDFSEPPEPAEPVGNPFGPAPRPAPRQSRQPPRRNRPRKADKPPHRARRRRHRRKADRARRPRRRRPRHRKENKLRHRVPRGSRPCRRSAIRLSTPLLT